MLLLGWLTVHRVVSGANKQTRNAPRKVNTFKLLEMKLQTLLLLHWLHSCQQALIKWKGPFPECFLQSSQLCSHWIERKRMIVMSVVLWENRKGMIGSDNWAIIIDDHCLVEVWMVCCCCSTQQLHNQWDGMGPCAVLARSCTDYCNSRHNQSDQTTLTLCHRSSPRSSSVLFTKTLAEDPDPGNDTGRASTIHKQYLRLGFPPAEFSAVSVREWMGAQRRTRLSALCPTLSH